MAHDDKTVFGGLEPSNEFPAAWRNWDEMQYVEHLDLLAHLAIGCKDGEALARLVRTYLRRGLGVDDASVSVEVREQGRWFAKGEAIPPDLYLVAVSCNAILLPNGDFVALDIDGVSYPS